MRSLISLTNVVPNCLSSATCVINNPLIVPTFYVMKDLAALFATLFLSKPNNSVAIIEMPDGHLSNSKASRSYRFPFWMSASETNPLK